jgi:hypothetical protein
MQRLLKARIVTETGLLAYPLIEGKSKRYGLYSEWQKETICRLGEEGFSVRCPEELARLGLKDLMKAF